MNAAADIVTDDAFCSRAQQLLAGTSIAPQNTVHADFAAFRASKTAVRPLQTHQFALREDDGAGIPLRISCKVKTPDHLVAEYGSRAARDAGFTCADVNRDTAARVYANIADAGRIRIPQSLLVFDEDETTFMGSSWIGPYQFAYTTDDGRLHIKAKALRVDWENLWLSWAPDRLRGAYYCHLIAPEYLSRLVLGEAVAPSGPN